MAVWLQLQRAATFKQRVSATTEELVQRLEVPYQHALVAVGGTLGTGKNAQARCGRNRQTGLSGAHSTCATHETNIGGPRLRATAPKQHASSRDASARGLKLAAPVQPTVEMLVRRWLLRIATPAACEHSSLQRSMQHMGAGTGRGLRRMEGGGGARYAAYRCCENGVREPQSVACGGGTNVT